MKIFGIIKQSDIDLMYNETIMICNWIINVTNNYLKWNLATSTQKGTGFQSPLSRDTFGNWVPERITFSPQKHSATQNNTHESTKSSISRCRVRLTSLPETVSVWQELGSPCYAELIIRFIIYRQSSVKTPIKIFK